MAGRLAGGVDGRRWRLRGRDLFPARMRASGRSAMPTASMAISRRSAFRPPHDYPGVRSTRLLDGGRIAKPRETALIRSAEKRE